MFGHPPVSDRGVPLDRQTHLMLQLAERIGNRKLDELGPDGAREEADRLWPVVDYPTRPLHAVEDRWIEGPARSIRLRVYTPRPADGPRPCTVYLHGGGFVVGSLDSHDGFCRMLADRSDHLVISVDYRLAPEHPFPAAPEDCQAAFAWVHANAADLGVDPARIAVAGDSAGGNLATVLCQRQRDAGGALPAFQLLVYPCTDAPRSMPSHRTFAEGFYLTESTLDWYVANYFEDVAHKLHPSASPLLADDVSGLPPAHITTAGFDPLRDEGERYAQKLSAAGVETTHRGYDDLIHGYALQSGIIDAARTACEDLVEVLRTRV